METFGRITGSASDGSHTKLIDGTATGTFSYMVDHCAISSRGTSMTMRPYLVMKLNGPNKVLEIQLARRTDGKSESEGQGSNVRVQVADDLNFNIDAPTPMSVCKEIDQLSGTGLVSYECDHYYVGQYVFFSNDQEELTICEAKVFVQEGKLMIT